VDRSVNGVRRSAVVMSCPVLLGDENPGKPVVFEAEAPPLTVTTITGASSG
jgi:hypothetical protein